MKNNRVHITWNESPHTHLIPQGLAESFRCNTLKKAKELIGKRTIRNIKAATYKSKYNEVINLL